MGGKVGDDGFVDVGDVGGDVGDVGGDVGDVGKFHDVGCGLSVGGKAGNSNISKVMFVAVMLMIMLVLMIMAMLIAKVLLIIAH